MEKEIAAREEELGALEEALGDPATYEDGERHRDLAQRHGRLTDELADCMARWEGGMEDLENLPS